MSNHNSRFLSDSVRNIEMQKVKLGVRETFTLKRYCFQHCWITKSSSSIFSYVSNLNSNIQLLTYLLNSNTNLDSESVDVVQETMDSRIWKFDFYFRLGIYRDQRVKQKDGQFSRLKHAETSRSTDAAFSALLNIALGFRAVHWKRFESRLVSAEIRVGLNERKKVKYIFR